MTSESDTSGDLSDSIFPNIFPNYKNMFIQNFAILFKAPPPPPPPPLDFQKNSMPPLYYLPGPLSVTNDRSLKIFHDKSNKY